LANTPGMSIVRARIEMRSGFTIEVFGDESHGRIKLSIDWMQTGDRSFENVRKYIPTATENCCARLKKGGWKIESSQTNTAGCRVEAIFLVRDLRAQGKLEHASTALGESLEHLRMS
jgi:hypothetical protein